MARIPESKAVVEFFTQGQPMVYGPGEMILGFQEEPNGIYFIASGYVKSYSISDQGDEYIHLIYGSGELFPLVWAYLGIMMRFVFFQAMSDVVVWRVARSVFLMKLNTDLHLSYELSIQLAHQFKVFSERVDNLEYKRASQRIAYRLLFLATRFGIKNQGNIVIDAPITHETFANTVNLSRESVSRELEKLAQQHIIAKCDHRIIITDVKALSEKLSDPNRFRL